MLELPLADSSSGVPVWVAFAGVVLGALSAGVAPAFQYFRERTTREEDVKQYKRIVYRNFLDHALWYRTLADGDERDKRHKDYTADWYRINLITKDPEILQAIAQVKHPGQLDEKAEKKLLALFVAEIGQGGLGD